MAGECYEKVLAEHRPRRDWQMPAITIFGVVLLCVLGGIIFYICRTEFLYNKFKTDWVKSFVYAEHHGTFSVWEGDNLCPSRDSYEDGFFFLFWKGRPRKVPNDPPGLTIAFGDGSCACYWETTYSDYSGGNGAEKKPGVILSFTNSAGKIYCVEAENDYYRLRAWLRAELQIYDAPTYEEWKRIEESRGETP